MICSTCRQDGEDGACYQTRSATRFRFCSSCRHPTKKNCEICGKVIPFGDESSIHRHTVCYDCAKNYRPGPRWLREG